MKRRLKELAILVMALGVIGLIVLVSGVFPIKASSGHWAITRWLLDFASDRSVAFHSTGINVPPLDEPGMVTLGAATYESNCVFCHGQPGEEQPPVAKGMTPTPPMLDESISDKNSRELFYIVKHGIKFAGMPAWPTQKRDDEIWPMIAFLHELPAMDNATYRKHIQPTDAENVDAAKIVSVVIEHCAACHAVDGSGKAGMRVPILAGQSEAYLHESLKAYRSGDRVSGIMMPISHRLTDSEIDSLATYFSKLPPTIRSSQTGLDEDTIATGQQLAQTGDAAEKIPSCVDCHGPRMIIRSDEYPSLAGQPVWYLERQLELFAKRIRGGGDNASLMHPIADKVNANQRKALAAFYATSEP